MDHDARVDADPGRRTRVALTVWSALVLVAVLWGEHVVAHGDRLRINAPPLSGTYRPLLSSGAVFAIAFAVVWAWKGPSWCRTLSWRRLLVVAASSALLWAVALALVDGTDALTTPLVRGQYLRTVPRVGDVGSFLSTFADRLPSYNIHTQGHPPGMVLVLWLLDRVGLGGVGWNAVLVLAGGAASIPAVLVAARDVAGERAARAAAPFLVLVPAMIWWSSGDALFTGVSAWSVTAIVVATGRTGRRGDRLAAAGGVGLGVTAFLSYGLVLVALVPLVVAIARRNLRPVRFVALGAGAVFLAFAAGGFWWPDGLAATHAQYYAGVAARRPYSYFLVGDLAAFALALGPVAAVALARLRDRRLWWLVGGCLAAVAVADLSGMSKAEVERIWLPFVPWVLVATAAFGLGRSSRATRWLAVQGAAALAIAVTVRSPW